MNRVTIVPLACLALAACNQNSVSLTNASPEEIAAKTKAAGLSGTQMRPGQWETRVEVVSMDVPGMKGMPAELGEKLKAEMMKPRTVSSCMSAEDVKRPTFTGKNDSKCKFDKYEMSSGRIDATMTCPGPQGSMTMHMTGNFAADTFDIEQAMDMQGPTGDMHSKARVTGKRIGDCAAGEQAK